MDVDQCMNVYRDMLKVVKPGYDISERESKRRFEKFFKNILVESGIDPDTSLWEDEDDIACKTSVSSPLYR
jgi:hypothetical protein